MKLCGLTGGVGMGKSTTARFLRERSALVADADEIAHELVQPGESAFFEIQNIFGKKIISSSGQLFRDELAKIVFADAVARKKLEEILHPKIRERWLAQVEIWRKQNVALAVVVIPLLFETQAENYFEKIICTACSATSQRGRLTVRGWNNEQISQRISAQMPIEEKIARADFVIWSEGELENHARQVDCILGKL